MRSDDDVVVTRRFERADGEVLLLLHKPQEYPDPEHDADPSSPPWRCWYTLRFPDGEIKRGYSVGIDSMQALLLGIGSASHRMRYVGNGTPERRPPVRWLGEDDLGLEVQHSD